MGFNRLASAIGSAALLFVASTAIVRADVIDGEWCDDGGRHFTITGPQIVTPEGTKTTGNYSRHAFSYADPAGNGGTTTFMRLMNEQTVHLRVGDDPGAPLQVWTRCKPIS